MITESQFAKFKAMYYHQIFNALSFLCEIEPEITTEEIIAIIDKIESYDNRTKRETD